ncbi:hypothetical protein B296_00036061 [Ensete ventricosum]|uniref:Uncharacterized protein n=1 Tax=Ensete ventricosum TaxID=4639 RepID=A0A426XBN1_ENSVE|nr:hypothetical protein B296_00036061 [Ensete ventricosum]
MAPSIAGIKGPRENHTRGNYDLTLSKEVDPCTNLGVGGAPIARQGLSAGIWNGRKTESRICARRKPHRADSSAHVAKTPQHLALEGGSDVAGASFQHSSRSPGRGGLGPRTDVRCWRLGPPSRVDRRWSTHTNPQSILAIVQ